MAFRLRGCSQGLGCSAPTDLDLAPGTPLRLPPGRHEKITSHGSHQETSFNNGVLATWWSAAMHWKRLLINASLWRWWRPDQPPDISLKLRCSDARHISSGPPGTREMMIPRKGRREHRDNPANLPPAKRKTTLKEAVNHSMTNSNSHRG